MAACILHSQISVEKVVADLLSASTRLFRMRSPLRKRFGWYWREDGSAFKPELFARHITIIDDKRIVRIEDLEALLSKIAVLPFPDHAPPWRAYLINPAGQSDDNRERLQGAVIHFDHSIADGFRMDRLIRMMAGTGSDIEDSEIQAVCACLRRWNLEQFLDLAEDPRKVKRQVCLSSTRMSAGKNLKPADVVSAVGEVLDDLMDTAGYKKRRGTVLEVISDGTNRTAVEGNFLLFRALRMVSAKPFPKCSRTIAYRLIEPTGPWGFGWGAMLPKPLLKLLLRFWYDQFDLFLSFIPGARRPFTVGGAEVKAVYAVAPMLAEVPVCATIYSGLGQAFISIQTGGLLQNTGTAVSGRICDALNKRRRPAMRGQNTKRQAHD